MPSTQYEGSGPVSFWVDEPGRVVVPEQRLTADAAKLDTCHADTTGNGCWVEMSGAFDLPTNTGSQARDYTLKLKLANYTQSPNTSSYATITVPAGK